MRTRILTTAWLGVFLVASVGGLASQEGTRGGQEPDRTAEGAVSRLYELVTFDAGQTPDWDEVRSLFLDEAVIVLRTSRDSTTVFSLEGFVHDFVTFIEGRNVSQTGFEEQIVRMRSSLFRDMAHVLVLYEAHIRGSPRPPQQGIDSFLLVKRGDRWRIAAITNDVPTADHPVPIELRP
jgi:hypothetical protein